MGAVEQFLPRLGDVAGLAAVLAASVLVALAGRTISAGRGGPELNLMVGWGASALLLTLWGVASPLSMRWPAALILVLALAALVVPRLRPRRSDGMAALRIALLGGPLLFILAGKQPSQVDTFTHWLANAAYLMDHDVFPGDARAPSLGADLDAFPYNLQFLAYLAGQLTPRHLPSALTHVNLVLQLAFALLAARVLAGGWLGTGPERSAAPPWWACALGLLLATGLNPAFVPNIAFTSYGESGTAVALAFSAALGWRIMGRLAARAPVAFDAVALAAVLVVLVNLKQANFSLTVIVVIALALVAIWDRTIPLVRAVRVLAVAAIPALVTFAAWRGYVVFNLRGYELSFLPAREWDFATVPAILEAMFSVAAHKGGYFVMMALIVAAAAWGARARAPDAAARLLGLIAWIFLGYIAALVLVYVTAFKGISRLGVQSFWRYQTQLGLVGVLGVAVALQVWLAPLLARPGPRFWSAARALAVVLILALPFVFIDRFRRDLDPPKPFVRAALESVSRLLPADAGLALVHNRDNGNMIWLARGTLVLAAPRRSDVRISQYLEFDAATLDAIAASGFDHAWVYCVPPALVPAMPLVLEVATAYLLRHQDGAWSEVASWPHQPPAPTLIAGARKHVDYGCG